MTTDIEKTAFKKLSDKLIDEDIEIVLAVTKARDLVNEALGIKAPKAQWWLDDDTSIDKEGGK